MPKGYFISGNMNKMKYWRKGGLEAFSSGKHFLQPNTLYLLEGLGTVTTTRGRKPVQSICSRNRTVKLQFLSSQHVCSLSCNYYGKDEEDKNGGKKKHEEKQRKNPDTIITQCT